MLNYFAVLLAVVLSANAEIWQSPCPSVFQYGFLDEQAVGVIKVLVPIESARSFFTIVEVLPKAENFTKSDVIPSVVLHNKDDPDQVLRDIYNRNDVTFVINYTKEGPLFNYKIVRIWLNDHKLCEDGKGFF